MEELPIRKFLMPEVLFGPGCRALAGQYAVNLAMRRVLVVSDPGVISQPWAGEILQSLEAEGITCHLFTQLTENPKDYEVTAGLAVYRANGCNGIVAIGGGSPMDCAKGIGIVATNPNGILAYKGVDLIRTPLPPMVFIPSTAGTSSDVSQFTIINDTANRVKIAIISKSIIPDIALIDPDTTATMSLPLTAATGMDALVHAFEAYVSRGSSLLTDMHALEAVRIITKWLPVRVSDQENREAQVRMMLASMQAGLAFSNAILGAVHAMAHSLGGWMGAPHGECNAILLEQVVAFNYDAAPDRYDDLAEAMGAPRGKEALLDALKTIKKKVGITKGLRDLGVKPEDLPMLARKAHEDPCLLTNPKDCSERDLEIIYGECM